MPSPTPEIFVIHDLRDEEMEQYPLVEDTEESLIALGVDPVEAHFIMAVSRGEIERDCIGHDPVEAPASSEPQR